MKMNLTKGKISKLHNKKKQSVKKYKKRAKTHKTKTLRRKHKSVNLVKSTLKNYKVWFGGEGEGDDVASAASPIVDPSPIDNAGASPIDNPAATDNTFIDNAGTSPIDNAVASPIDAATTDNMETDAIPEESPMEIGAVNVPDDATDDAGASSDIPNASASDIPEESPMDPMDINTEVGTDVDDVIPTPSADDNIPEFISQENTPERQRMSMEESTPIIDESSEIEAPLPAPVEEIAPTPMPTPVLVPVEPQEQISADDLALLRAIKAIVNKAVQQPQPLLDENAASSVADTALTFANANESVETGI